MPSTDPHRMDHRDLFLYWWPVTSRLLGVTIALYEMAVENIDRPSILALAGSLLVLPNIADAQRKRNEKRAETSEG